MITCKKPVPAVGIPLVSAVEGESYEILECPNHWDSDGVTIGDWGICVGRGRLIMLRNGKMCCNDMIKVRVKPVNLVVQLAE